VETAPGAFFRFPRELWGRLGPAFAAAGNRIGWPHLLTAGGIAAAVVIGFTDRLLGLSPAVVLILGGAAALAAPTLLLRLAQARYRNQFLEVFPDALDLVARAVKAGLPVTEAMGVAAREIADPVGSELRQTLEQAQIGVHMGDALQQMADRIRVPDFRFYVVALALQQKTGGSLAETLANLSTVIRARKALRLKARALSSEAKASAAVLGALPFFVGGAMSVLNPDMAAALFLDPRGRFMLGVAFLSLLTGLVMMAQMIKRSLR
jgi:tight adherence protein B